MAPVTQPSYLQAISLPASVDRYNLGALFASDAATGLLAPRPGVIVGTPTWAVAAHSPANMTVDVPAGRFVVPSSQTQPGAYLAHNDATYSVAIAAAHATLIRKDAIVARVRDSVSDGGGFDDFDVVAVLGTPGAGVRPATPNNSILLAEVNVGAAVTSITAGNVTALHKLTVAPGGILPAKTTDMPSLANQYIGQPTYDLTTGKLAVNDGVIRQIPHEGNAGAFARVLDIAGNVNIKFFAWQGNISVTSGQGDSASITATNMSTVLGGVAGANIANVTSFPAAVHWSGNAFITHVGYSGMAATTATAIASALVWGV